VHYFWGLNTDSIVERILNITVIVHSMSEVAIVNCGGVIKSNALPLTNVNLYMVGKIDSESIVQDTL